MQLGKRLSQILGMHELVRGVLQLHLPPVGGARRWGDEEQFARIRQTQMFVPGVYWGVFSKVDACPVAQDVFAVPDGADADGGFLVEKGYDDAAERL